MNRIGTTIALNLAFLLVGGLGGCGTSTGDDVFSPDSTIPDSGQDIMSDTPGDARDAEIYEDTWRDTLDTRDKDADLDTIDIGKDGFHDAETVTDQGADPGRDSGMVDMNDPCAHCPGLICDPETLECLECRKDVHCGSGSWCDSGTCRPHLCSPGANFCHETVLYKCSENGGGFTVISDCDDKNPCTEGDRCENGRCVDGIVMDCSDDNPCTIDYCSLGVCDHYLAEGIVCTDNNPCTKNDLCSMGRCVPGNPDDCDDANPCTIDYCTQMTGCIHEPVAGACNDASVCTFDDRCIEGRCGGSPVDCDDGNQCTTDYCTPDGCAHATIAGCEPCQADTDCVSPGPCEKGVCDVATGTCRVEIQRTDGCCVSISDCPETPACVRAFCDLNHFCRTGALDGPDCCRNEIMTQDFTGGLPESWEIGNEWLEAGWKIGELNTPIIGLEPPALYFGNEAETSFDVGVPVSGTVRTAFVTIPAATAARMSFDTWQDVDPVGGYDRFEIHVVAFTTFGQKRYLLWKRPEDFVLRSTREVQLDVSAWSGRTVAFEFSFDSIDEIDNQGRGVYIDNVMVRATCTRLGCKSDFHCKSAGINGFCIDGRCDFSRSWMQVGEFGSAGSGAGQFTAGTDLVVIPGPEGIGSRIVVSDSRTHYLQVFESDGEFVRIFGGYGVIDAKFLTPRGMASGDSKLLIADSQGGRIQALSPAGVFLYDFGSAGIDPGQFDTPRDVAMSPDGESIYVADTGNHRISVFNRLGVYRFSFGAWGTGDGRFRTPSALTVTSDGRIWVADTQNNRVQVFSPKGILQQIIKPASPGAFYYPGGIAALPDGGVVVADTYNHRLVILDAAGEVEDILGTYGNDENEFNYPSDVDVMTSGGETVLVVADPGNFRVTKWAVRMW